MTALATLFTLLRKKALLCAAGGLVALAGAGPVWADGVNWSVGIGSGAPYVAPNVSVHVGNYHRPPPRPVYVAPQPVYVVPAPVYAMPPPRYHRPPHHVRHHHPHRGPRHHDRYRGHRPYGYR